MDISTFASAFIGSIVGIFLYKAISKYRNK